MMQSSNRCDNRRIHPQPEVSVVIPVWNGAAYLDAAIQSVADQSFSSIEIIIVDDGSDDGSLDIANACAARDARIRVIALAHNGIAHALNAGVNASRGRFIARMDADDVARSDRLRKQVDFLEANPNCVLVGSAVEVIDERGAPVGAVRFDGEHDAIVDSLLNGRSVIAHPTVLARREALLAAGGYDGSLFPSEDYALWLRMSEQGELRNLEEPLLRYRRHEEAVSIREYSAQLTMTAAIVMRARQARGLRSIHLRRPRRNDVRARYHFDCARLALAGGRNVVALRHATASIACDPRWLEAYMALAACFFPFRAVRSVVAMRTRLRGMSPATRRQAADTGA